MTPRVLFPLAPLSKSATDDCAPLSTNPRRLSECCAIVAEDACADYTEQRHRRDCLRFIQHRCVDDASRTWRDALNRARDEIQAERRRAMWDALR